MGDLRLKKMSDTELEDVHGEEDQEGERSANKRTSIRNLSAFWLLGLCNNYAYVIMLSAAYDILDSQPDSKPTQQPTLLPQTEAWLDLNSSSTPKNPYDCNDLGTGVVLLADILPSLFIKYTAPLFAELIPYDGKVAICLLSTASSFIIVSFSRSTPISLIGIACASFSSGLGEYSFLSLAAFYDKNVVSTWSSGTGAAGLFGALSYAGLTAVGLSPRSTILVMLLVPLLMTITYWILLVRVEAIKGCVCGRSTHDTYTPLPATSTTTLTDKVQVTVRLPFREKLHVVKSLLYLMIPLALVYIGEYFINQALFELLYFPDAWLPHDAQYRWYQVIYQFGVFISRSSVNVLLIRKTWILAVLQMLNVVIFVTQLFFFYIPSIYIVFVLILYEGLLGGSTYVNTFYLVREEVEPQKKEFALGVTAISDASGIAVAAAMAVPAHQAFCNMRIS